MMPAPPRALRLAGGAPVWRYGPGDGPQLVVLQPLFEEANRTRALVAALCRGLAGRGIGCWLPDLPGTGEDGRDLTGVTWRDWSDAVRETAALAGEGAGSVAIRGGALLDGGFAWRWRLAPVTGRSLLRDLERAGLTGEPMAGYDPPGALRDALAAATPIGGARTVRMAGDDRPADARIDGPALWRRAEPAGDAALAETLIADIRVAIRPPGEGPGPSLAVSQSARDMDASLRGDDGAARGMLSLPLDDGWIAATIEGPHDATRAWLFVTGGSQTRTGPSRLYERLAAALAARGDAVIRFDRRGVGDSLGEDRGYMASAAEIAAAARALAAHAPGAAIAGFGLCDGATALALHGAAAGVARIVAANPWVVEATAEAPAAAAVRAHYRDRLRDPGAWTRLLSGGVDLRRLLRSLARGTRREDTSVAAAFARGLPAGSTIVLADGDNTARAFAGAWARLPGAPRVDTVTVATRSHVFAGREARDALLAALTRRR